MVAAPRPAALAMPAPTFGTAKATGGAIPGIGAAVAMPVLPQAAPFDVFSIRQAEPSEARGGGPPADGGPAAAAASAQGGREGRGHGQDDRSSSRCGCHAPMLCLASYVFTLPVVSWSNFPAFDWL